MKRLICRTCLEEITDSNGLKLDDETNRIKHKLSACVPEMKLDLVPNACICVYCANLLQSAYDFKERCLVTEEKIRVLKNASDLSQIREDIELDDAFDVVHGVGIGLEVVFIKDQSLPQANNSSESSQCMNNKRESVNWFLKMDDQETQRGQSNSPKLKKVSNGKMNVSNNHFAHNNKFNIIPKNATESPKKSNNKINTWFEDSDSNVMIPNRTTESPRRSLRVSALMKKNNVNYNCTNCEYETQFESYFRKHIAFCKLSDSPTGSIKEIGKTNRMYKCSQCNFRSALKKMIDLHTKRVHKGSMQYKYSKCFYVADGPNVFLQRQSESHSMAFNGEFKFNCTKCSFGTNFAKGIKSHLRKHARETNFSCRLCNFKEREKIHIEKHAMKHHPKQYNSMKREIVRVHE